MPGILYGGVRYLRDLLLQFQDVVLALAAYNAGENAVSRFGNRVPPFPETRRYVDRVLGTYVGHYRSIWSHSETAAWLGLTSRTGNSTSAR